MREGIQQVVHGPLCLVRVQEERVCCSVKKRKSERENVYALTVLLCDGSKAKVMAQWPLKEEVALVYGPRMLEANSSRAIFNCAMPRARWAHEIELEATEMFRSNLDAISVATPPLSCNHDRGRRRSLKACVDKRTIRHTLPSAGKVHGDEQVVKGTLPPSTARAVTGGRPSSLRITGCPDAFNIVHEDTMNLSSEADRIYMYDRW